MFFNRFFEYGLLWISFVTFVLGNQIVLDNVELNVVDGEFIISQQSTGETNVVRDLNLLLANQAVLLEQMTNITKLTQEQQDKIALQEQIIADMFAKVSDIHYVGCSDVYNCSCLPNPCSMGEDCLVNPATGDAQCGYYQGSSVIKLDFPPRSGPTQAFTELDIPIDIYGTDYDVGSDASVSADGLLACWSANRNYLDNNGALHIAKRASKSEPFVYLQSLMNGQSTNDWGKGAHLAPGGSVIVICDPQYGSSDARGRIVVYTMNTDTGLFEVSTNILSWTATAFSATAKFGHVQGVAISEDGNLIVVGSENEQAPIGGVVVTYTRGGVTHGEKQIIYSPEITSNYKFGYSVCLSYDGSILGITNYGNNNFNPSDLYIYFRNLDTDMFENPQKVSPSVPYERFGHASSMSALGDTIAVSSFSDRIAIFSRDADTGVYAESQVIMTPDGDYYANKVQLSGDGFHMVVGHEGDHSRISWGGSVYTYARNSLDEDFLVFQQVIDPQVALWSGALQGGMFGSAIALDFNGETLVAGAFQMNAEDLTSAAGLAVYYQADTNV